MEVKPTSLVFFNIARDCRLGQCLTSSTAESSKKNVWPKSGPKGGFAAFSFLLYLKMKDLNELIFHISWLYRISFTYNPTASFFRHRIVEWPWIEFKMRPMLFRISWNFSQSDVAENPVKLACFNSINGLKKQHEQQQN